MERQRLPRRLTPPRNDRWDGYRHPGAPFVAGRSTLTLALSLPGRGDLFDRAGARDYVGCVVSRGVGRYTEMVRRRRQRSADVAAGLQTLRGRLVCPLTRHPVRCASQVVVAMKLRDKATDCVSVIRAMERQRLPRRLTPPRNDRWDGYRHPGAPFVAGRSTLTLALSLPGRGDLFDRAGARGYGRCVESRTVRRIGDRYNGARRRAPCRGRGRRGGRPGSRDRRARSSWAARGSGR